MSLRPKTKSGFSNPIADKIWNDHVGNNEYTKHRDSCPGCSSGLAECADGLRILSEVIDRVDAEIELAMREQN